MDDNQLDLYLAMEDRRQMGCVAFGPLTLEEMDRVGAYEQYMQEMQDEHDACEAAGGRTICEKCEQRNMVWQTVVTYGYAGHPGADYSEYGRCENCGHEEL